MNDTEKERIPWIIMTAPGRDSKERVTFASLIQHGVNPKNIGVFKNIDLKTTTDTRPYQKIITEQILQGLFPMALTMINRRNAPGFYFIEDNTLLKQNFKNHYLFGNKITWLGWLKNLATYTVGSKLLYFPKHIVERIVRDKNKIPLGHTDRVFRNYGLKNNELYISPTSEIAIHTATSDIGTEKEKAAKAKIKNKFAAPNPRIPMSLFKRSGKK